MPKYYDLMDNMRIPGRWHLRSPVDEQGKEVNPWQFDKGRWLEPQGRIRFPVKPAGLALEFTLTTLAIPVVHGRVVQLFERLGIQKEVQFIPAQVEGQSEPWFILNALRIIPCIDDARCAEVQYWKPEDNRPDKVGQYRAVHGMRIDPTKPGEAHIFRPWGWRVALVISETVKEALEKEGITGTKFVEA
ncbi:MAG: imm11 family protein [Archangium sp.]